MRLIAPSPIPGRHYAPHCSLCLIPGGVLCASLSVSHTQGGYTRVYTTVVHREAIPGYTPPWYTQGGYTRVYTTMVHTGKLYPVNTPLHTQGGYTRVNTPLIYTREAIPGFKPHIYTREAIPGLYLPLSLLTGYMPPSSPVNPGICLPPASPRG